MLSVRFAAILLLVSSALATPLNVKRAPWNRDLVSVYARTDNSSQSNSTAPPPPPSDNSKNNNSQSNSTAPPPPPDNSKNNNNSSQSNPPPPPSDNSKNNDQNQNQNQNQGSLDSYVSGFDNFNGQGNFDGSESSQVIVVQEKQVVCHTEQIEIIQQKLVILREMAKRIITEQVCEVETQTIVLEQFSSSLSSFQNDIGRKSSKQVGYDQQVSGLIGNLQNSDGSLSTSDLGFSGSSVGSHTVVPQGNNWDNSTGPDRVSKAQAAAKAAANSTSSS